MNTTLRKVTNLLVSFVVLMAMMVPSLQPSPVSAQAQTQTGLHREYNAETGKVTLITGENHKPISVLGPSAADLTPEAQSLALVQHFATEFGLTDPAKELKLSEINQPDAERVVSKYQQMYQGVPVMAGELIVNASKAGELISMNGEVSQGLSLDPKPELTVESAIEIAKQGMVKWYEGNVKDCTSTQSSLWIFDETLLRPSIRPVNLVWQIEMVSTKAGAPIRELVLVDAKTGNISLHFNQVDTAWTTSLQAHPIQTLSTQTVPSAAPSIVKYEDLVVDEARNRLYGADKVGNKIDVINMTDLSVVSSYSLVNGALPISLDLSPDGNELAIAQSGIGFVKFVNLTNDTITEIPSVLSGSSTKVTDVVYGRAGVLYALSSNGLHVINLTIGPHAEDTAQYVGAGSYEQRFGAISSDRNTLYYVTGTCCSGYNSLNKYDVSTGLIKPTLLKLTHLYGSGYQKNIRLSLINDASILITTGAVYNTSDLTPKAKNFQSLKPAIALTGKDFYVSLEDYQGVGADILYFYNNESSYKLSSLSTGVIGTPGAITTTNDGNTLFVSSTGGLAKFTIGVTPPGTPISLPASQHQYNDLAIDMPRGLVYGTDNSGRIDVIDLNTANVVNSYLLPSGANPIGIDLSPNGNELAIALNGLQKILFINSETGVTIAEVTPQLSDDIYYTNLPFDVIYGRTGRLYSDGNPSSGGIDYLHVIDTTTHTWVTKSPYPLVLRTGAELVLKSDKNYAYANQTFSPNNIYIYNVQTDSIAQLYQGPHGPVSANKFTIVPDGSKIFTSSGQVWDSIMQSQLGMLAGAPGKLIEYIPNQNTIALSASGAEGDVIKFISPVDYSLLGTYTPSPAGVINEMEVAPDGSKLVININNQIMVLNVDVSIPSSIRVESGSDQSTPPQTQFTQPLKARVQNNLGLPVSGITVTFTAPSSGASGVFFDTNSTTTTAVTDINGDATSSAFFANSIMGSYVVHATVDLVGTADFHLVNGNIEPVETYTSGNSTILPGTFVCDGFDPECAAGDTHAKAAHKYAIGTYNLYLDQHGRNSIDDNNMSIVSTVRYSSGYANAFWSGAQMVYGDAYGFPLADDVVAHELTHGVTQYESNLFYFYQSGAINESFSDVWGEYYDQSNGLGTDTPAVKWLIGEDVSGSTPIRSMSNPPTYGDPDKMSSANYDESDLDNGGVHTNSGVNNKAVFLMVDGGSFNSKTVSALGWDKTAAIYYEAQTNLLSSGADYSDLYYALQQACANLGLTAGDCQQVKNALDAVEMNSQPAAGFNPDAPICAAGTYPTPLFQDDMESGTSNWAITNAWSLQSGYASSPVYMWYGDDYYPSSESALTMANGVLLPSSSSMYLHFKHAFAFEYDAGGNYDGGVLEYSTNNGTTWTDASSKFVDGQNYKGTILNYAGTTNTLKGRNAFVRDSHGYVSSRYNLTSLGGQTVKFRWRFATDSSYYYLGWLVDDVQIYTCGVTPPVVVSSTRANVDPNSAATVSFTVKFSQSVTGVDISDFNLTTFGAFGAYVSGVSGAGTTYTVSVNSGSGSGTIQLNVLDNDSILNPTSLPLGGAGVGNGNFASGETYTISKAPLIGEFTATSPANSLNIPITAFTVWDTDPIGYMITTSPTPPLIAAAGWNPTPPTSFTVASEGSYTLYPWVKDAAGNVSEVFASPRTVVVDATVPAVTNILRLDTDPNSATSVHFNVTFSESVTGVNPGDFNLTTTGVLGTAVSGVSGSGSAYTVTVSSGSGSGTIQLNVADDDSIADAASNSLGGSGIGNGDFILGETYTITKTWVFGDVPNTYWSWGFIESLYNAGITGGCSAIPLNYCPTNQVTRAQMAIFLVRAMHGVAFVPPTATGIFTDVPVGSFGANYIEQLAADGITSGCGGGNFCPTSPVTRASMAVFLVRAKHGTTFVPPTATGIFTDVPVGSFGADFIEQLVADSITSGCGAGVYCPATTVKRDSMAVFLVRTFNLP